MKIQIYDWAGQALKPLKDRGFFRDQVLEDKTEEDLWKLVRELFDAGLEVMVRDMDLLKPRTFVQIGVDVKGGRFRQR